MWYVAHLLFAQKPRKGKRRVLCESCHVLFRTESALKYHDRAAAWAKRHEKEVNFYFVGVQHIKPLDGDHPDDGSEVGGRFYHAIDVWKRVKTLIPRKTEIPVVKFETHHAAPIRELMNTRQKQMGREIFSK